MPQASDEQRELMQKWFRNDGINDAEPMAFLISRGYTTIAGMWQKPTPSHSVSWFEWECLDFLCDEWDYGYNFKGLSNHTELAQKFWTEPDGTVVYRSYRNYCRS